VGQLADALKDLLESVAVENNGVYSQTPRKKVLFNNWLAWNNLGELSLIGIVDWEDIIDIGRFFIAVIAKAAEGWTGQYWVEVECRFTGFRTKLVRGPELLPAVKLGDLSDYLETMKIRNRPPAATTLIDNR